MSDMSPFTLLNITEDFDIDLDQLEQHYLEGQKAYHPDKWVAAPSNARRFAAQKAADMNGAYRILKNPVSRARYFLEKEGLLNQGEETIADPELLAEIFELQENKPDAQLIQQMVNDTTDQLKKAFRNKALDKARFFTLKLGYLVKL